MARPPMPLGSYETINVKPMDLESGKVRYRARTYFRGFDGRLRPIERWDDSGPKAKRKLQAHLATLIETGHSNRGPGLKDGSRFRDAAEVWLTEVADTQADTTADNYRQRLNSLVLPALGDVRLREINVGVLDAFMGDLRRRGLSVSTLRNVRTVLTGTMGVAVRHGAIRVNPARDMARLGDGVAKRPVRALTTHERSDLLTNLDAEEARGLEETRRGARRVPDMVRFMLATGCRVGELVAVRWCDVDLDKNEVRIRGNIVPVRGKGLVRHEGKTAASNRVVALAPFLADLLRYWQKETDPAPGDPVFPNALGSYRDPSRVGKWIRQARDAAGYPWLTSHVFRKTAATILDEMGFSAREIADMLGHSRPSITQDVYMHRGGSNPRTAEALDEALRSRD